MPLNCQTPTTHVIAAGDTLEGRRPYYDAASGENLRRPPRMNYLPVAAN